MLMLTTDVDVGIGYIVLSIVSVSTVYNFLNYQGSQA